MPVCRPCLCGSQIKGSGVNETSLITFIQKSSFFFIKRSKCQTLYLTWISVFPLVFRKVPIESEKHTANNFLSSLFLRGLFKSCEVCRKEKNERDSPNNSTQNAPEKRVKIPKNISFRHQHVRKFPSRLLPVQKQSDRHQKMSQTFLFQHQKGSERFGLNTQRFIKPSDRHCTTFSFSLNSFRPTYCRLTYKAVLSRMRLPVWMRRLLESQERSSRKRDCRRYCPFQHLASFPLKK